ncbi:MULTISPECIES: tRNA glutamyl-Q(34) synthetase GluQRS [Asticcacaulis]|uniref:tRNA glutamyl-Q(34) synthetase GluQRS n=1 Tax=Asticcacaulis TaxID=76890 RepID=UPI001AE78AB0|nr:MULTISPECIES: tRNA glutamyl-Q(34) synthetase GluQRS [Asticcacaulis]MBP2161407.1 glutamyl-Q tRNA(Asp) synthetase [Asticcacaulis solisilvae]MDR6802452.1 glutamyl-Q tRNA(Asp) synthetase [Asticcacaulis sp. BE141]
MTCRTRFAPSPTGYLHLGHAYSALTAYEISQDQGGQFILRVEDIDHTRCRPHFEAGIYTDLAWLGLSWPEPVLRQSEHISDYRDALERLIGLGVVYADHRTRKEQVEAALSAPQDGDHAETFTGAANAAWRLSLDAAREHLGGRYDDLHFVEMSHAPGTHPARPEVNGDVVLGRKDIGVAYHLAVVVDDARQGITHVVRGHDLFEATHTQVLLQALLGLPLPVYHHHALLLDEDGRRLAKRKGSKALGDYRDDGLTPQDIRAMLAETPKA